MNGRLDKLRNKDIASLLAINLFVLLTMKSDN